MSTEPTIELRGAGKRYRLYEDNAVLISRGLRAIRRTTRSRVWALRGVDLEVAGGESLGVIGRNGSGKTTMLKMLAGVSAPTEGRVIVRGRVAPLMAVGVGFHPELTGRENVYLNATILGLSRPEIDDVFDDIVAFAEVESFIDTPVKFYSSGMLVRLGFSVAIRARPSILLVDEVLAVGDLVFQSRCFSRMQELRENGTTVVLVTHNLDAVRLLCDRTLLLHDSEPRFLGPTGEAISIYHELLDEDREPEQEGVDASIDRHADIEVSSIEMLGPDGERTANVDAGAVVTVRAEILARVEHPHVELELHVATGAGLSSYRERWPLAAGGLPPGQPVTAELALTIALPTGTYAVMLTVVAAGTDRVIGTGGPYSFFVGGRRGVRGLADLGARFHVDRPR